MAEPKDAYDDQVRRRLAEIRASAGIPSAQVALDVLYMLPGDFLKNYGQLFTQALKADGGESARNNQQQELATVGKAVVRTNSRGQAGPSTRGNGRRYKKSFVVLDERALRIKSLIDKRLRQIGREIERDLLALVSSSKDEWMSETQASKRSLQCLDCKMFLQFGWKYCPQCGRDRDAVA